jgi:hypothetical protein
VSDRARELGSFANVLKNQVVEPRATEGGSDDSCMFALNQLDALTALASAIAVFEQNSATNGAVLESDIEELAKACFHQGPWGRLANAQLRLARRLSASDVVAARRHR